VTPKYPQSWLANVKVAFSSAFGQAFLTQQLTVLMNLESLQIQAGSMAHSAGRE